MNIAEFKSCFYHSPESINWNNAGQALIPKANLVKAHEWLDRFYKEGALAAMSGWGETENVRKKLAQFLGAEPNEVAYFQTTASALSQAALGIPLQKDDEILTWDQEYPSNFYPWRLAAERAGAKVVQVASKNWQTSSEAIIQKITSKTKVIAVSWVQYQTGAVTDLKAIANHVKGKDIWLVADVIQGVGVRPFHFHESGFDIVCGGSHKWLCSSYGASFMVIKNERLKMLNPIEVGAMTYGDPDTTKSFTITPKETAHRFEPGSKAMLEIIALGATLDLFQSIGMETIFNEANRLANTLRESLRKQGFELYGTEGPIVNFSQQNPESMAKHAARLTSARVAFAKRGPGIRLSPHAYNTDEELDRILSALK